MSSIAQKCTLHCLFASASPAAVIYRRGPSNQTCLIAWDRGDDSFRVGQWFKGRAKPSWGGLSPNGEWLVSFLAKYRGPFGTWTNLSRPPFLTAVSLWPVGHTWYGGGWFLSDRELVLRHHADDVTLAPGFLPPPGISAVPCGREPRPDIARRTARMSPWRLVDGRPRWAGPRGHVLERTVPLEGSERRSVGMSLDEAVGHRILVGGSRPIELPRSGWAAFDGNGDLLFSEGGRLHRLSADVIGEVATQADLLAAARCLADFSGLTFTGIRAPYETPRDEPRELDGAPTAFLPRLDRTTREGRRAAKRERQRGKRQALRGA